MKKSDVKEVSRKSLRFSTALQGATWGPQDAGHAADAIGRRVFSCPGMGRVLSQRAKKRGTFVSPARAVPQASAPFHSVFNFRVEGNFFSSLIIMCVLAS